MDITQNHCEKQIKNILVYRLIMSYNEQEFKDNSSGRGVIPHRRYSPRPMETWLNRCDSGTDSIVWMEEEMQFFMLSKEDPLDSFLFGGVLL